VSTPESDQPDAVAGPLSPESVRRGAEWLVSEGVDTDVVISCRVRLARNVAGMPFLSRATPDVRQRVLSRCRERIVAAGLAPRTMWVDVHTLPQIDRQLLVERHLMSKEHAKGATPEWPRGLCVSLPDERLAIMVNEEDHLRLQLIRSGLALSEAWRQLDGVDDALDEALGYAFHPRFGYLTACPTNVGCACRMSVMLHLPGLRLIGEIEKVRNAARDMALVVRGFYGEGSEATGDLFQLSNQTTLGKGEQRLLRDLEGEIIPAIVRAEREARRKLVQTRPKVLEDQVFRALGTLRYARLLPPEEALTLLSLVRLGLHTGLIQGIPDQRVSQLIVLSQPAHLQRLLGREMDQQARREARADLIRERLAV
jgi:protein arginine kinase